jgi:two-component system sensor histidine kinase SenX3
MEVLTALLLVLLGLLVGVLVTALVRLRRIGRPDDEVEPLPAPLPPVPSASDLVHALPVAVVVLDGRDDVVLANRSALAMGVVREERIPLELRRLVRDTRRSGTAHESEIELAAARLGRVPESVRVRLAPFGGSGHVALLVEDVTEARRVEAVRRDFVANVSHELKTPVGAMAVLAEALAGCSEDPEAVRRFAGRVQHESERLARLVQELIDLSRLQGADPLPDPEPVAIDHVVSEALDRTRTVASSRGIGLVRGGTSDLWVTGSASQLVTALANLLENAVAYSPDNSRVATAVRLVEGAVEISVTDQGIGISDRDLQRVFERFYRADPARSRVTGGTGLGLAIVKHVATNHGGEVDVWSVEGSGSTFTLRLPAAPAVPVSQGATA